MKESTNTMISSPHKPHTNAHSVCGRPILNVFERVAPRTLPCDRSIYERTFLSKAIESHAISNELSNVNRAKKHLHKHYRVL